VEKNIEIVKLTTTEIWEPTMQLRWFRVDYDGMENPDGPRLQQCWRSNLGEEKWEDVPFEIENKPIFKDDYEMDTKE
jgi:hypothetical protein